MKVPTRLRSIATLAVVTALSQVSYLALAPVLSRLYGPEQFGVYGAVVALGALLSVVASLRYEQAMMLPDDRDDAVRLGVASCVLATFVCGVAAVLWELVHARFTGLSLSRGMGHAAILLGWLSALAQVGIVALSRNRRYGRMGINAFIQQGSMALVAIALAAWPAMASHGLVTARLLTKAAAAVNTITNVRALPGLIVQAMRGSGARVWALLREHRAFALYNTPFVLLVNASREFLILVLMAFHQPAAAGAYAMTRTVILAAPQFLSSSMSQVFYREAVSYGDDPRFPRFTLAAMTALARVGAPMFALLALWGPDMFAVVFGAPWVEAGRYAALLSQVALLAILTSWSLRIFEVRGRQSWSFAIQAVFDGASVAVVVLMLWQGMDVLQALIAYAVLQTLYQGVFLATILKLVGLPLHAMGRLLAWLLFGFGAVALLHTVTAWIGWTPLPRFVADTTLAALLAAAALPAALRSLRGIKPETAETAPAA